jgi:thiamine-phosphate pyrophosphorylase
VEEAQALSTTEKMLQGGVQILQLRAKKHPEATVVRLGQTVAELCRAQGVPFILNDHPALVAEVNADGAHIGQDDMPVAEARRLIGLDAILGKSSHSVAQATATAAEEVDYLGFGPLFATPTKPDYQPIGLQDIHEVHQIVQKPIFCIGGVKKENLSPILVAGAQRIVIVSGILQATDIVAYCRDCREALANR